MQLVRCEQCGAKALIAASQCPRCAHAFFLRDSRGETVPLGHCGECDTYYPRSRGGCKWCGTKASSLPVSPLKLVAGLVAAACIVAVGVWQYRARSAGRLDTGFDVAATTPIAPVEIPLVNPPAPAIDSATVADSLLLAGERVLPAAATTALDSSAGTVMSSVPAAEARGLPPVPTGTQGTVTSTPSVAPTITGTAPPAPARYAGPWTRAVAQSWVNVRAAAAIGAAVVGVVTPNTRVQLGENRGGWRRVRSAGFEGWADGNLFSADTAGAR